MNYIQSANIIVFPSGFRGIGYGKSKLTSEDNLIRLKTLSSHPEILNQIFQDPYDKNNVIIFIHGYYFNIPKDDIPKTANLYAGIKLRKVSDQVGNVLADVSDGSHDTSLDDDSDGIFYGLGFSSNVSELGNDPSCLLQVTDTEGNIKFSNIRIALDEIGTKDGKSLDDEIVTKHLVVEESAEINNLTINGITISRQESDGAIVIDAPATSKFEESKIIAQPDTTLLPPNNSTGKDAVLTQDASENWIWVPTSNGNLPNTVVKTDANGKIIFSGAIDAVKVQKFTDATERPILAATSNTATSTTPGYNENITLTGAGGLKAKTIQLTSITNASNNSGNALNIDATGKVYKNDLSVNLSEPGKVVTSITQAANGKVSATFGDPAGSIVSTSASGSMPKITFSSTAATGSALEGAVIPVYTANQTTKELKWVKLPTQFQENGKNKNGYVAGPTASTPANSVWMYDGSYTKWGKISASMLTGSLFTLGDTLVEVNSVQKSLSGLTSVTSKRFVATSDARLKENVEDYECKNSILDLPIKKFDFIDGEKNQIGCLAQDLQKICPELVSENDSGYLGIQESKLVYLLINEVKKLRKELDDLKGNIK